jgi:hypothetical protein
VALKTLPIHEHSTPKHAAENGVHANRIRVLEKGLTELDDWHVLENASTGETIVESTESWTRRRPQYTQNRGLIENSLSVNRG